MVKYFAAAIAGSALTLALGSVAQSSYHPPAINLFDIDQKLDLMKMEIRAQSKELADMRIDMIRCGR